MGRKEREVSGRAGESGIQKATDCMKRESEESRRARESRLQKATDRGTKGNDKKVSLVNGKKERGAGEQGKEG